MRLLERLGRKALFAFDPETAHGLSIAALKSGLPPCSAPRPEPSLRVSVAGIDFPNPLGMAAGYDKNAEVTDALLKLGFGFAEVGTVTPLPQPGNPRPRIFRLAEDDAVINRLGFNNEGHDAAFARLSARAGRGGIVGVNIGANKDSADRFADYEAGVRRFASIAAFLTVNISSPNTPGLRSMQAREALAELLSRVSAERGRIQAGGGRWTPIFLKIAPDLSEAELSDIAEEVLRAGIDGIVVSNTTLGRAGLRNAAHRDEAGGLSGRPLFERSTAVLARIRRLVGKDLPLIGVGGVDSAETAIEKIKAGADLVQLYTGMIYAGPSLPGRLVKALAERCRREGLANIGELRDSAVERWVGTPLA